MVRARGKRSSRIASVSAAHAGSHGSNMAELIQLYMEERKTLGVIVNDEGMISMTAPMLRRFKYQEKEDLIRWCESKKIKYIVIKVVDDDPIHTI